MKRIIPFILCALMFSSSLFKTFSQQNEIFKVHVEVGYFAKITRTGDKMNGSQFFITPAYPIGNNTNLGIGTGIKLFKDSHNKTVKAFPLYAAGMYRIATKKVSPFIEGKLGYTFMNRNYSAKLSNYYPEHPGTIEFHTKTKGGLFFSPAAGVLFPVKDKQRISLSAAYVLEQDTYTSHAVEVKKTEKGTNTHHAIALRIGYMF